MHRLKNHRNNCIKMAILAVMMVILSVTACGKPAELADREQMMKKANPNEAVAVEALDEWVGHYTYTGKTSDDGSIRMNLFLYREADRLYGYLCMDEYEGDFYLYRRMLTQVHADEEGISIYFDKVISQEGQEAHFGTYQKGDLLFSMEKEDSGEQGFVRKDYFSIQLVDQSDIEAFLTARGISEAEPFYRYYDESGNLQLELYWDEALLSGTGIFYSDYVNGFPVTDCEPREWQDHKWDVTKDGRDASKGLEEYEEHYEYNEQGQLISFCSEGILTDLGESDKVTGIRIEYFYREDGTLERKKCYYNGFLFETTRQSETCYYDSEERLSFTSAYITHGRLEYYYIYADDDKEPSYCLILDHYYLEQATSGALIAY